MVVLVLEVVLVVLVVDVVLVEVDVFVVLVGFVGAGPVVDGVVAAPTVDEGDVSRSDRVHAAASRPNPPTNALRNNALRPSGATNASGGAGDAGCSTDTRPP